jgi:enamine deaminase RidA (YjgF/YER057c/UK114 family)
MDATRDDQTSRRLLEIGHTRPVVRVTVLLVRTDLYKEMNEAYAEFFPGPKPARAMARFGADIPGVLVAIEAIALA